MAMSDPKDLIARPLLTRRRVIGGLGLLLATPAIVRAAILMPVRDRSPEWMGVDFGTGEMAAFCAGPSFETVWILKYDRRLGAYCHV